MKRGIIRNQQERKLITKGQTRMAKASAHLHRRPDLGAVHSLTRTKALLLAALKVWELRNPVTEDTESLPAK